MICKIFSAFFLITISLLHNAEGRQRLTPTNGWYKVACIAENLEETDHYICTKNGTMVCLPGWSDEKKYCTKPVCEPKCINGNCTNPNVCECDVGWQGDQCNVPVCLPGCLYGNCSKPFQCTCNEGWTGMLCNKPICREGCFHGTCSVPGECNCHPGWFGKFCEKCERLPECVYGSCERPMECICDEGYEGNFCHKAICRAGCNKDTGFCTVPGECWCLPGYQGVNCTECQVYPGCDQGTCTKAWECNCLPGYSGKLCNILGGPANTRSNKFQRSIGGGGSSDIGGGHHLKANNARFIDDNESGVELDSHDSDRNMYNTPDTSDYIVPPTTSMPQRLVQRNRISNRHRNRNSNRNRNRIILK